jgi:hypothetical protein
MNYKKEEIETIGLCICLEAINNIVNHSILDLKSSSKFPDQSMAYFNSSVERDLFLIRFLDFVKESGNAALTGVSGSCLTVLESACNSSSFNKNESISELKKAISEMRNWLSYTSEMKLWLPTLEIDAKLQVSREEFLFISGNQSKHNLSRLMGVSKKIQEILIRNGYSVQLEHIPLALDDFSEHLQQNYFIYYGTWIAELLNNIRWGLHVYLIPIFNESFTPDPDGVLYNYKYPEVFENEIPKMWFWRLMNHVRAKPYVDKFKSPESFKSLSSLEW